jgi:hypothetical protein
MGKRDRVPAVLGTETARLITALTKGLRTDCCGMAAGLVDCVRLILVPVFVHVEATSQLHTHLLSLQHSLVKLTTCAV